ncbi:MAG: hypothetical protein ACLFOY_05235 [Desulfatibacillaceae bacterium]
MKYRYVVKRDDARKVLVIREFAKRNDDQLEFTGAGHIPAEDITAAMSDGLSALVSAIRTDRMYPPGTVAVPMAEAVMKLYGDDAGDEDEAVVEEIDVAPPEAQVEEEEEEEDTDEEDDLLDEDADELDEVGTDSEESAGAEEEGK